MHHQPLKVTAIVDGEIGGQPPYLDSLLETVMAQKMRSVWASSNGHRHHTRLLNGSAPVGRECDESLQTEPGRIPSPILYRRVAGYPWPIPACSSPIFVTSNDRHDYFNKRTAIDDPEILRDRERKKIDSTSGEFKAYRLPLRARLIDRVVWFCVARRHERKDYGSRRGPSPASKVRKMLKQVESIGRKRAHGFGRVHEWIVEAVEEDWSWFAPSPDGMVLMRPLPVCAMPSDSVAGAAPFFGALHPPYFDSCSQFFAEGFVPCS